MRCCSCSSNKKDVATAGKHAVATKELERVAPVVVAVVADKRLNAQPAGHAPAHAQREVAESAKGTEGSPRESGV